MIVQTTVTGKLHFIVFQTDHAAMCGQFAAAFGNREFVGLDSFDPMMYVAVHHDAGWLQKPPYLIYYRRVRVHLPSTSNTIPIAA